MSPHLHLIAQPFEQGIDRRAVAPKLVDLHVGKAVFAVRALCNGAPEIPRDFLVDGGRVGGDAGLSELTLAAEGDCGRDT